jgi:hypothetical protein
LILRFGITKQDIFRGINDTTNSALLTGKLIADGRTPVIRGTTCHMHAQELVVQHALGLRDRTRMQQTIDAFPEGKALKEKVKILVSAIMNKHNKKRYIQYHDYIRLNLKQEVRKLYIPNDTRVSGIFYMYESVLRSRKCIHFYLTGSSEKEFYRKLQLSETEWQLVAETHAVLKVMNVLAMTSQKETVGSNCFSYYSVANARYFVESKKKLKVLEIFGNRYPSTEISKWPMVNMTIEQLKPDTQMLIERLVKEFDHYFKGPDSDQVMMMVFHPVMVWRGLK